MLSGLRDATLVISTCFFSPKCQPQVRMRFRPEFTNHHSPACPSHVSFCLSRLFLQVRMHFRPEFINRIDEFIIFQGLQREQIKSIVLLQVGGRAGRWWWVSLVPLHTQPIHGSTFAYPPIQPLPNPPNPANPGQARGEAAGRQEDEDGAARLGWVEGCGGTCMPGWVGGWADQKVQVELTQHRWVEGGGWVCGWVGWERGCVAKVMCQRS